MIAILTVLCRRVYIAEMKNTIKRDSSYWLGRLEKDGHGDLLDKINAGELTVYKATQEAGYRAKGPRTPAAKLSHHWRRADHAERKRFVMAHLKDVNRVIRDVGRRHQKNEGTKTRRVGTELARQHTPRLLE